MSKPTLHVLGPPHTIGNLNSSHCAFSMKAARFVPMMQSVGYNVVLYWNGSAQDQLYPADKFVSILSQVELDTFTEEILGEKPTPQHFVGVKRADVSNKIYQTFNDRLQTQLRARTNPHDIVCLPFGHAHLAALTDLKNVAFVETGIGYPETFAQFQIFESNAWYHWHLGRGNRSGSDYHWVIPNYYDLNDWHYDPDTARDYVLYFGRITQEKGLDIVREVAKYRPDLRFVLCGQGDPRPWLTEPNIEYHEPVVGRQRATLLNGAIALLAPTRYVGPFEGVTVEAFLCGLPVLGASWGSFTETIEHGSNGFRCRTLGDFLAGLECIEQDGLWWSRGGIARIAAQTYDMYKLAHDYDAAFQQIADLAGAGWYTLRSEIGPIARAYENP